MPEHTHVIRYLSLAAISFMLAPSFAKASTIEDAADYYLYFAASRANLRAQLSGNTQSSIPVEYFNRGVISTFGASMNNLDDELTLMDIKDFAYRKALKHDISSTGNPDRYDFNRDGVATEQEINLFFADEAWKWAFAKSLDVEQFSEIRARFEQRLAKLVGRLRDREDVPDGGDISAESTMEFTERGLDPLSYQDPDQLPFMSLFDVDQSQSVSFDEFMEPMKAAIIRADVDGNGLIDETELAAIEMRHEDIGKELMGIEGKYGFDSSGTK